MNSDIRKLVWKLRRQGVCVVEVSKHIKLLFANGGLYFMPKTPSDSHWYKNLRADIRKIDRSIEL